MCGIMGVVVFITSYGIPTEVMFMNELNYLIMKKTKVSRQNKTSNAPLNQQSFNMPQSTASGSFSCQHMEKQHCFNLLTTD